MTHPNITIFNTLGRQLQTFEPLQDDRVSMYSCGPTVYAAAHIGNMRSYVFADLLRRMLEYGSYRVDHVINITDVGHLTSDADEGEDKLEVASRRERRTVWDIARHYEEAFKRDIQRLRVQPPTIWARATDHIDHMLAFAKSLDDKGFTYQIDSGLFFDTSLARDYGALALLDMEGLLEGARVTPTPGKRNPIDFAVWRASPLDSTRLMEWGSPWGPGAPGWHLECSTMSIEYLGDHFDLHTGGIDHISTHHTNEIAQSEAYLGDDRQWVSYWMHNDFVVMPEGKMAKSEGRVLLLDDLTDAGYHPLAYRHLLVASHYRKPVDFSWDALESARIGLQRLLRRLAPTVALAREMDERPTFERTEQLAAGTSVDKYVRRFHDALWNDLNTPKVLATLYDASRDSDLLDRDLAVLVAGVDSVLQLGLIDLDVATLERVQPEGDEALRVEVTRLVDARSRAREKRDYAAADAIRDELRRQGVAIEDTENGTSWRWTKNLEG